MPESTRVMVLTEEGEKPAELLDLVYTDPTPWALVAFDGSLTMRHLVFMSRVRTDA